jgi:hypothetical protein
MYKNKNRYINIYLYNDSVTFYFTGTGFSYISCIGYNLHKHLLLLASDWGRRIQKQSNTKSHGITENWLTDGFSGRGSMEWSTNASLSRPTWDQVWQGWQRRRPKNKLLRLSRSTPVFFKSAAILSKLFYSFHSHV